MTIQMRTALMRELPELRFEPTQKRIRAVLGGETAVDSMGAILVWEPGRVVPSYGIPERDVVVDVGPATDETAAPAAELPKLSLAPGAPPVTVLDPSVPFAMHTTDGEPVVVRAGGHEAAGFRPAEPALSSFLVLDFAGFDAWYEEDARNIGHPRDPFHRIDVAESSRHVRVAFDGETLADSSRPCLLFEPPLPVRCYLPPEDVDVARLRPSDTRTVCAYKGEASYWSLEGAPDIAWTYRRPLHDAAAVKDRIAFFDERVDVELDGRPLERPVTPWSRG